MSDFECLPIGTAARLKELEAEVERLRKATQLCDKHAPNGGTVSACVICSGQKLSYALSRISYLCEPPNEMEFSSYDLHYNEEAVVAQVERLRADAERYRWLRDGGADKSNIGVYEWIETYGQQRRVWLARQELDDSIDAWRRRLA
jgi:hypothetical protein